MMEILSRTEIILLKTKEFYRLNLLSSDDRIKTVLRELIEQWSDVLIAGNDASNDEFFYLNVTRGLLYRIFVLVLAKDGFKTDHSFTREIFRSCSELLINNIDLFRNTSMTIFQVSNVRLIMEMLSTLMSILWYTDIDLINEQLLLVMREYVDQDSIDHDLLDGILSFIWNLSDNTSLVPILLKTNYATSLCRWIEVFSTKFRGDQQNALINILHNMSRHDDAMEELNRLDILNIIEQIEFSVDLSFILEMIRILLTDINRIKLESMVFLNQLVSMTISAGGDDDYRHEGSHVCELLTVLAKLFYNDEILVIILESKSSLVEFFVSLLIKSYPNLSSEHNQLYNFTCVLLMNILSCISYHQEYASIIYANKELISIIQNATTNEMNFIDMFMPRTMKSIEQAAIAIGKNLNEISESGN